MKTTISDIMNYARMDHDCVEPGLVQVPKRLRAVVPAKVKQLAESMAAIGLQQPITVWSNAPDHLELVAGAHRLAAAIKLGWPQIDVISVDDMPEIDRQLWEIDENLMRAELTTVERDNHLVRREELWERRDSGATCATIKGPGMPKGFATETADATGLSKATINRSLSRAKSIPSDIRDQIKGTALDTGVYLDSIKGMDSEDQRAKVNADLAEPKKPAPVVTTDPAEGSLESLKRLSAALDDALKAAAPETRKQFRAWQAEIINTNWRKSIEGIVQTGRDLIAAKRELPDGEFTKMIETDLPFSRQAAQQLMAIASDPAIANPNRGSDFPPSWVETVLAQLASLSAEDFEDAQERGLTTKRVPS